ncbi:MAG: diaminopimelate decarboxylase [Candidatus Parcubacteria bacterium]|nr:diaminopimelate decarboxylase [Candidatus Parcubacteria bacterium]
MPMSADFQKRLEPILPEIIKCFGTPFHIYDERGIRQTGKRLKKAFKGVRGFKEFFAVKANPNLVLLKMMAEMGFGFDCSSIPELQIARQLGAQEKDVMFTSNNTSEEEFWQALKYGSCILNLDDISMIPKVPMWPKRICFRYNPGKRRTGNSIIGNPVEAKYGVTHEQIVKAYRLAKERGARKFGLHTMVASNELNYKYMVETVRMLSRVAEMVQNKLGIRFEFWNMGGGIGIPYRPEQEPVPIELLANEIKKILALFKAKNSYVPKLFMECGRYITGPHGVLVTTVINRMSKYREYVGVDACMSSLMRPALYDAHHTITILGKDDSDEQEVVDVVGSLCENNDKFAKQRKLPKTKEGDILIIHETGAHGLAMCFNYNGRLWPKELLLREDGIVELIRRAQTVADYLATQSFEPQIWELK